MIYPLSCVEKFGRRNIKKKMGLSAKATDLLSLVGVSTVSGIGTSLHLPRAVLMRLGKLETPCINDLLCTGVARPKRPLRKIDLGGAASLDDFCPMTLFGDRDDNGNRCERRPVGLRTQAIS